MYNFRNVLLTHFLIFLSITSLFSQNESLNKNISFHKDTLTTRRIKTETKYHNGIIEYCRENDKEGKTICFIHYDDSGRVESIDEYIYDGGNLYKNIMSENSRKKNKNNEEKKFKKEVLYYLYDSSEYLVTKSIYDTLMNLHSKTFNNWDVVNRIHSIKTINADGTLIILSETKYDEKKKLIEYKHELPLMNIWSTKKYIYDDEGNNTEIYEYSLNPEEVRSLEQIKYSMRKKVESEILWYDYWGKDSRRLDKRIYNDNERIIEETTYNIDGEILWSYKFKYDKYNNVIEEIHFDKRKDKQDINTYKYEYH